MNRNSFMLIWKAHSSIIVLVAALLLTLVFYFPTLSGHFIADDHNYINILLREAGKFSQGDDLIRWFITFYGGQFFRPVLQWLWLFDFIVWNTNAIGYHITNVVLHTLNIFLVYVLAWLVVRDRFGAIAAGLVFALQPIHAESVSWIADRTDLLSTLFYLLSAVFFVLHRVREKKLYLVVSLAAFALAALTKETTIMLPFILVVYDFLFHFLNSRWKILRAEIPFFIVLLIYFPLRFVALARVGGYLEEPIIVTAPEYFFHYYTLALIQPFLNDIDPEIFLVVLAAVVAMCILYRERKGLWFGLAWIVFSFAPATGTLSVAPRLVYAPSVGWAVLLGAILSEPLRARSGNRIARAAGLGLLAIIVAAYGFALAARVDDWFAAGRLSRIVVEQTKLLHPTVPPRSMLAYVGVSDILRGIYVYTGNFDAAIQNAYKDVSLGAVNAEKIPILSERLDRTFIFEFRRGRLSERQDMVAVLKERQSCAASPQLGMTWDFSHDMQNWQVWNDLADFENRNGMWMMRSTGNDPYIASPEFDLPSIALGDIEIKMSVRADHTALKGVVYWLVEGQEDFSPKYKQSFDVQADGDERTYRVNLPQTQLLYLGDHVRRLRLNPTDAPAEIGINTIRIWTVCSTAQADRCVCIR